MGKTSQGVAPPRRKKDDPVYIPEKSRKLVTFSKRKKTLLSKGFALVGKTKAPIFQLLINPESGHTYIQTSRDLSSLAGSDILMTLIRDIRQRILGYKK